jgi:glycerol-3-phosphate dehydrogenase
LVSKSTTDAQQIEPRRCFIYFPQKVLESIPNINEENLIGGVVYHDGQFDDARLAVNLAQTIMDEGGTAVNYLKVTNLIKNNDNLVEGVELKDEETTKKYKVKARAVVNATGVFADDILKWIMPMQINYPGKSGTHLLLIIILSFR